MRQFSFFVGKVISVLFPRRILEKCRYAFTYLYTGYYSRCFKEFGRDSTIVPKVWSIRGSNFICIGDNVLIGGGIQLTAWKVSDDYHVSIRIGDGSCLGSNNHITAINSIDIGKNVLTGKNVTITDNSHGASVKGEFDIAPKNRKLISKGSVIICDNVWIGDKVTILPGVKIGMGSIIGANSVVGHDVPPYCIVAGAPAKIVKQLTNE